MKISTKTLASLLLITAVATVPGISRIGSGRAGKRPRRDSHYARILQHHDRKGELRASVLGLPLNEFRLLERTQSREAALRSRGFANERMFRKALFCRIKHELRQRGWTSKRIDEHVAMRVSRIS